MDRSRSRTSWAWAIECTFRESRLLEERLLVKIALDGSASIKVASNSGSFLEFTPLRIDLSSNETVRRCREVRVSTAVRIFRIWRVLEERPPEMIIGVLASSISAWSASSTITSEKSENKLKFSNGNWNYEKVNWNLILLVN